MGYPIAAGRLAALALRQLRARTETILIVAGFLAYVVWLPPEYWGDGEVRGNAIIRLVETGHLTPMKYSYVGPLFSIPLYLIDKLLHCKLQLFQRYNYVVLAAGFCVAYFTLRRLIEPSKVLHFFLLLLAASMFPYHLRTFYGEVFSAVWAAIGILLLCHGRSIWGWILIILSAVNTPALAVPMSLVALKAAIDERKWTHLLPPFIAALAILLEAWISRGSPFISGYEGDGLGPPGIRPYTGKPGFSYPIFFGVLSILFSFGRGILFYVPGLWLALRSPKCERNLHRTYVLWMCFLVGEIIVYAGWNQWHGAGYWGPRFFLFACIPASFLLVSRLTDSKQGLPANLLTFGVLLFSSWVGINGLIFRGKTLTDEFCDRFEGVFCLYVPEFSPLWLPFVRAAPVVANEWKVAIYCAVVFVVLSAPLVQRITRQSFEALSRATPLSRF